MKGCFMKQLIIARKDLNMSPGKLAAQVSHASMAFLTSEMKNSKNVRIITRSMKNIFDNDPDTIIGYEANIQFDVETYEQWISGIFTKIVCEARNKNHLEKVLVIANELGLKEGKDYFLIKDACLTELIPEEIDENGIGRTLTCIGFRPLPDDICRILSKKYQLLK
jgi:PTH2 family peptidyl-tRNA hydrolase